MKTFKNILFVLALFAMTSLMYGQATMTTTTLTAAVSSTTTVFPLASVTGVSAPSGPGGTRTVLYIDRSAYYVTAINGLQVTVTRGVKGTVGTSGHANASVVYIGPDRSEYFTNIAPSGNCTATALPVLPRIDVITGKAWSCVNNRWGVLKAFYVNPSNCTFIPTTLTTTNILTQVGASGHMVMQGTSNAAAGTNTLTCNILPPSSTGTKQGIEIVDIQTFLGSQTTAQSYLRRPT